MIRRFSERDGLHRQGCFWTANGENSGVGCRAQAKRDDKHGRRGEEQGEYVGGGREGKVFPKLGK